MFSTPKHSGAMPLTNKAIQYAIGKHAGQYREISGLLYITHPINVMAIVYKHKNSKNLDEICAACILHDVIEDTSLPPGMSPKGATRKEVRLYFRKAYADIRKEFNAMVADLVWELTSDPFELKKVGKQSYIDTKLQKISSYAALIKLADILANANDAPKPGMIRRFRHHHDFMSGPDFGKPLTLPQQAVLFEIDHTLTSVYQA